MREVAIMLYLNLSYAMLKSEMFNRKSLGLI